MLSQRLILIFIATTSVYPRLFAPMQSPVGAAVATENSRYDTGLYNAAAGGNAETALNHVMLGADVNNQPVERTATGEQQRLAPLHMAAQNGHVRVVALLLGAGATNNLLDRDGWTPLMHAAAKGHTAVAQVLIADNAALNLGCTKFGYSALQYAIINGHMSVVRVLIDAKNNIAWHALSGDTALHTAARYNRLDAAKLLYQADGATNTILVANKKGEFPDEVVGGEEVDAWFNWCSYHLKQIVSCCRRNAYPRPA